MANPHGEQQGDGEQAQQDKVVAHVAVPATPARHVEGSEAFKKVVAILLAALAGALLVTQNGVNTNLRTEVANDEPIQAAFISFSVGLVSIFVVAVLHAPHVGETTMRQARWYSYMGGALGPIYIVAAVLLTKKLGFAVFQLGAIAGQLTSSLLCDAVGFLHLPIRRPSVWRILAVAGTFGGTILTVSDVEIDGEVWEAIIYTICAVFAGTVFPVQAVVNGSMQKHLLTPFRAAVVSFAGGVLILLAICLVQLAATDSSIDIESGEAWMWSGGALGACLVTCNIIGVPLLGAGSFSMVFLASQLSVAFVYDTIGAFGFESKDVSAIRIVGVGLAILSSIAFQLAPTASHGKLARSEEKGEKDVQSADENAMQQEQKEEASESPKCGRGVVAEQDADIIAPAGGEPSASEVV